MVKIFGCVYKVEGLVVRLEIPLEVFLLLRSELGGVLFLYQERCMLVSNRLTASTNGGAL